MKVHVWVRPDEIISKVVTEKIFDVEKTEARFAKLGPRKNVENVGVDSNQVYTQLLQEAEFETKVKTRVAVTPYPSGIQAELEENHIKQVYKTTPRIRGKLNIDLPMLNLTIKAFSYQLTTLIGSMNRGPWTKVMECKICRNMKDRWIEHRMS